MGAPETRRRAFRTLLIGATLAGSAAVGLVWGGSLHASDDDSPEEFAAPPPTLAEHAHMHDDPMGDSGGPAEDSDAAHEHAHERNYDGLWSAATASERAAATRLVEQTRAETARYAEYAVAAAAGYVPNAQAGPEATHHPNRRLMRDGRVLDPGVPESLMYWTARDGTKVFVGAVYKTNRSEGAPAPAGELAPWHTHAAGEKCYPALDAACPQDTPKMLHVFFFDGVQDPFTENMVSAAGGRAAFARAMRAALE